MTHPKVLLTDRAWPEVEIERAVLAAVGAELIVAQTPDEATLVSLAREHRVEAIMTCWARVTAQVLSAAGSCRIVARMGIGLDNIDVAFATARGILVTNVPDYCQTEVAEHALALILALGRNVAIYHADTKAGRYALHAGPPLQRIQGQVLGIVGLGGIGRTLARKALALGMRVAAATRSAREPPAGVELLGLEALLAHSDYVSLHVPLTPQTRHLIGRDQLALMKPTAFVINTSRGAVLDEAALAEALAADRLAGAALDVQEREPPDLSQPPFCDRRVIVTPHAAFVSAQSLCELRTRAARQVADCLLGRAPENIVNRDR